MNKRKKFKTIIATLIAISVITCIFSVMASATDINISVNGDLLQNIAYYYGYIRGPLQVGLDYFIAFMQYMANYIAQF